MAMRLIKNFFRASDAGAQEHGADPGGPDACVRDGFTLELTGDFAAAEAAYRAAIEADGDHAEAHFFLGRAAYRDKRFEEAIALFERACELNPGEAIYLFDLGHALRETEQFERAQLAFEACGKLVPGNLGTRINRAVALIEQERHEEARVDLERLRQEMPDMKEALFNLAGIYREYALIEEGVDACRAIRAMNPDHAPTASNLLMMLHYSTRYDAREIFAEHLRYGEAFARRYLSPNVDESWPRRLRIGYVSADFNAHVVMYFFEPILAMHDRGRFEVFCYHTHPLKDVVTDRLRQQVEHFVDAEYLTREALADRIRSDRIDILVDLAGHSAHNSLPILAAKPAPVQVSYLGYPDTTGLPAVDYRISDRFADPPGDSDALSVERIVRMPASYFCYRPPHNTPALGPLPAARAGMITFGCFNNFHKISNAFLDSVARVLAAVPASRFMLKGRPLSIPHVADRVRARFELAGIPAERVVLRGWEAGVKEHLAIYNEIDIALDCFPYNGATTTCEALWMGVPVVTLTWDRHAGRAGASLLNAVGLGELVARDVDEYVALCAGLASDHGRLAALRAGMRDRMKRSPLMDEAGFTRDFEAALLEMWRLFREQSSQRSGGEEAAQRQGVEAALQLKAAGRSDEAQSACARALASRPDSVGHLRIMWDLAFEAGRPGMAIDWLLKAIAANGAVAEFHYMLGCALQEQEKPADAAAAFESALRLDPDMAKAHSNLGCVYEASGDLANAMEAYRRAIELDPTLVQAIYNLGNACRQLGQAQEAIAHIRNAVRLDPKHADWSCNLGELHAEQDQLDDAIACFVAAIEKAPDYAPAHRGLGAAQAAAGRLDEAIAAFARAAELAPENPTLESWLMWLDLHRQDAVPGGGSAAPAAWARRQVREFVRTTAHPRRLMASGRRLNVACLLPDPRWSDLAPFVEALARGADPKRITLTCYAKHAGSDEGSVRLKQAGCRWRDLSDMNANQAALWIRSDATDVLLDLAGHAPGGLPLVVARGPAPVQAAWLGYPGELCLDAMGYRISDARIDPPGAPQSPRGEEVVSLERSMFCYVPPPDAPEAGNVPFLSAGEVTFGSLADLVCLTPETLALWARILGKQPGVRLLLGGTAADSEAVRGPILQALAREGVARERVEFLRIAGTAAERMRAYRRIDIVLDSFPWNGTLATCEALWMGAPVVSLAGASRQARSGASILHCAGLDDLLAADATDYVRIATALADERSRLGELRATLRARLRSTPLLDATGFARAMEQAFRAMLAKARAGMRPRDAA
jgi:predicted O-linked N-acetylglucosamine transferase (SPINDLY family)